MAVVVASCAISIAAVASGATTKKPTVTTTKHASPKRKAPSKKHAASSKKKKHEVHVAAARGTSRLTLATSTDLGSVTVEPLVDDALLPRATRYGKCREDMASIEGRFCIDKYEASLVEIGASGSETPFSPFSIVEGHTVRAVSVAGAFPQGYVSGVEAKAACARSGKRLCAPMEWRKACVGPETRVYGYGDAPVRGTCNDRGKSPMFSIFGPEPASSDLSPDYWGPEKMNDPRLNALEGTLAKTGAHPDCTNAYGVFDMVGNLHEWVDDADGTFQGGYYLDTSINGEGCAYRTVAHEFAYHDYSTGFRCCADPE